MFEFPIDGGIVTIRSTILIPAECTTVITSSAVSKEVVDGGIVTIRSTILIPAECTTVITSSAVSKEVGARPENFKVALHPDFLDQEVAIEGTLSVKGRIKLCSILKENLDIFAWQPSDMTGVSRSVAEHRLNIREGYSPVRQKKRSKSPECTKAIQAEVQNLVEAGIMREVYYHDWLSNPVMDCYPLPKIDWKVESFCGYPFKCFLDAYKCYHPIQLAESDEEKKVFHTGQGVYYYTKMPFGLKNAGATCQRLVDKAFDNQIGRNIEVYVDELVVKSHTESEMLRDIDETFRTLRKINMKLNPKKYMFGAVEGVFLGYVVTPEGIKLRPDKTAAVLQLLSPRTIKEVQSLNGKLASLNRFLSKSAENQSSSRDVRRKRGKHDQIPRKSQKLGQRIHQLFYKPSTMKQKQKANALSKIASTNFAHLSKQVLVEILKEKSIKEKEVTTVVEEDGPTWMTPIMEYLKERTLPSDRKEARKLRIQARQYELLEGVLYRRPFFTPWLRCVGPLQAEYVIREIHEGRNSMHAGPRSFVIFKPLIRWLCSLG
nr:reverse transcriptase domain-containing protein [Tanacetum cinerariifolium]